jgi:hypothetical protein
MAKQEVPSVGPPVILMAHGGHQIGWMDSRSAVDNIG